MLYTANPGLFSIIQTHYVRNPVRRRLARLGLTAFVLMSSAFAETINFSKVITNSDGTTTTLTGTINVDVVVSGIATQQPSTPTQNAVPVAQISASVLSGVAPLAVSFDGSGSKDADGQIASYAWNFGDGGTGSAAIVSHTFNAAGTYNVVLTVKDNLGATGTAQSTITVSQPATAPTTTVGIPISPGASIQAAVNANPNGTTFTLKAGVHRLQSVAPKDGNVFLGEAGTVLNGSRLLTSFTREGTYWVATGQTQQGQVHGGAQCDAKNPGCQYPEDLYFDDVPLMHVLSLAAVAPGKWFFDYGADKIYFVDDPTGRKVETSVSRAAFSGAAANVVIKNLVVEKYAIPPQMGAIGDQNPGLSWTVESCELRLNHGVGLRVGNKWQVRNNKTHHNGQMGFAGVGDDVVVEGNEIYNNNILAFNRGWEAGGFKFVKTNRLIVRNNISHDNIGLGMWTDIDNINTLYEGNEVYKNVDGGLSHEISYAAVIRNNKFTENGQPNCVWLWGGQLQIQNSQSVEAYGNTIKTSTASCGNAITVINQNRGTGAYGPYIAQNNYVHHNNVVWTGASGGMGAVTDVNNSTFWGTSGNRFDYNTYHAPSLSQSHWNWSDKILGWSSWRGMGTDPNGTLDTVIQ